jgi:hypothetical protein
VPNASDDDGTVEWPLELSRTFGGTDGAPRSNRFFGRSSNVQIMQAALALRSDAPGTGNEVMQRVISSARMRPDFWKPHPVHFFDTVFVLPR